MRRWLFPLAVLVAACAHGFLAASDDCRSKCDSAARGGACRQTYPEDVANQHPFAGYQGCLGYNSDPNERFCNEQYKSCVQGCEKSKSDGPLPASP